MTNYPSRDDLARELYIKDNRNQSREASVESWAYLTAEVGETYTHPLADAALELFKAANPEPEPKPKKKAKGGKITGPPPAGAVQVTLSGQSITEQVRNSIDAEFLAQVSGQVARASMNRNIR